MIAKKDRIVVTFYTTTAAMKMEDVCKARGAEGRIIPVPGAAISLPVTVFDVVLPQIFAGERFTKQQLINLADGGLCQLCSHCHFPNCSFGRY
ncbi:MAG: DUF3343 domain-containing protein [Oscillospiraceae bacterium]|nr:DUF3343 domain-containing protein [Oscillospiraceae bacterium]